MSCDLAIIRQFKTRASSLKSLRQKIVSERDAELLEFWRLDAASPGHLPWPTKNAGYGLSYSSDPIEQRWLELYLRLEHDVPGFNWQPSP